MQLANPGANGGTTASCSANKSAPVCNWEMTGSSYGGCGSQGGGGGGNVCVGPGVDPGPAWSCNVKVCSPQTEGLTYQSGYAERWDGYPACDTTDYMCVCN